MTNLFFIRHGETLSNITGVAQGNKVNQPLTSKGLEQAESLKPEVLNLNLDLLFSSDLFRAKQTAEIVNSFFPTLLPLHIDHRLEERDLGSLSKKTWDEIEKQYPGLLQQDRMQSFDYKKFGGENVENFRRRIFSCLVDICEKHTNKNIGVITHGGAIRLLLFHFPEITRIYKADGQELNEIVNTDIYDWEVGLRELESLKTLI